MQAIWHRMLNLCRWQMGMHHMCSNKWPRLTYCLLEVRHSIQLNSLVRLSPFINILSMSAMASVVWRVRSLTDFVRHSPRVLGQACSGGLSQEAYHCFICSVIFKGAWWSANRYDIWWKENQKFLWAKCFTALWEGLLFMSPGTTPQTACSTKYGLTSAEAEVEMQKYLNN